MVFRGHVKNGVVLLDDPTVLSEGAAVQVELLERAVEAPACEGAEVLPIEQELAAIWADVPAQEWANVPRDLSDNLDHYIYGMPKN